MLTVKAALVESSLGTEALHISETSECFFKNN